MSRSLHRLFLALFAAALGTGVLGVILANGGGRSLGATGEALVAVAILLLFGIAAARSIAASAAREELRSRILQVLAAAARRGEGFGAALDAMGREHDGAARGVLRRMQGVLDGGGSLEGALEAAGRGVFPEEDRAAVGAVAGTSRTEVVLEMLSRRTVEGEGVLRRMGLPLVYATAIFAVGSFLAIFILPQFGYLLNQFTPGGPGAPQAARGLRHIALASRAAPILLSFGAALILLFLLFRLGSRTGAGRRTWREGLLLLPGAAGVVRLRAGERVCRILGVLVAAGVPLHEALSRAAGAAGVPSVEHALDEAAAAVANGEPLARALERSRLPRFAADRIAAASAGAAPSLAAAAGALSRECGVRARLRTDAMAASVYPAVLLLGAAFAFLVFSGIFDFLGGMREGIRAW